MPVASLAVASPAWRAGRAAASLGGFLRGDAAADDVLDALMPLGEPAGGWWEVLRDVRAGGDVALVLPRPGDPRGLALPRGVVATAAIGWPSSGGRTWLIPEEELAGHSAAHSAWRRITAPDRLSAMPHQEEALRDLRRAVVAAAHAVDALDDAPGGVDGSSRRAQEQLVDSWVLGPPPLPASSRHLASLGLRMLLAIDGARALTDATPLERAARSAVESAFRTTALPG